LAKAQERSPRQPPPNWQTSDLIGEFLILFWLTGCGATTTLNLLVDITARTQPHNGSYAQVAIQRPASR
jgi:hypothetical protein